MKSWIPILEPSNPLSQRAWDAVTGIANAIHDRTYSPSSLRRPHWRHEDPLLYGYLAVAQDDQIWLDRTLENLNLAVADSPILQRHLDLFGGICGLGWSIAHISQLLSRIPDLGQPDEDLSFARAEENDLNEDLDAFLIDRLRCANWDGPYDLISGLVGFGTYFLERYPAGRSREGIELIIGHLQKNSQPARGGITWHSNPAMLPDWQRELCPEGYFNLGVAHGIPGILHFLSEVAAAGIDHRADPLLDGGVRWLLTQKRPVGSLCWFSPWLAPDASQDSRLSWCYGDLGILAVLHQIIRRFPRDDWRDFTHALLEHCLAWPMERAGVNDAPLCHGAAGVGHIFNRIYQADGDSRCRSLAIAWLERALDMRVTGAGNGGFLSASRPDPDGPMLWEASPAFLDGAIGIALALLSALMPIEPQWDRILLLSGRARTQQESDRMTAELIHCHES